MIPSLLQRAFAKVGPPAVKCVEELLTVLRQGIVPRDNVRLETATGTAAGTANTEFTIDITALKLAKAPTYIITLDSSNGGVLYASSKGSWTSTSIKAKCTVASTVYMAWVI